MYFPTSWEPALGRRDVQNYLPNARIKRTPKPCHHGATYRSRGFSASELRLERQGQPQGFHVEPAGDLFGPGSVLYFHSDTTASSSDFSSETAWELVRARGGALMPIVSAAPAGDAPTTASTRQAPFEINRFYQPGLLDAPDLWLWDGFASGATRTESFSLTGVNAASSEPVRRTATGIAITALSERAITGT
jgi:hypothetical protein